MTNPLEKLQGTIILGLIITIILALLLHAFAADYVWTAFFFRWLHVLSGVMWIGLLWYFQLRADPVDAQDSRRSEAGGIEGNRAGGAVLVPLGRAVDHDHRADPGLAQRLHRGRPDARLRSMVCPRIGRSASACGSA